MARRSRGQWGYVVNPKGSAGRRGLSKPGGSQAAYPRLESAAPWGEMTAAAGRYGSEQGGLNQGLPLRV
jgi:hypothetical protein